MAPKLYPVKIPRIIGINIMKIIDGNGKIKIISDMLLAAPVNSKIPLNIIIPNIAAAILKFNDFDIIFR